LDLTERAEQGRFQEEALWTTPTMLGVSKPNILSVITNTVSFPLILIISEMPLKTNRHIVVK